MLKNFSTGAYHPQVCAADLNRAGWFRKAASSWKIDEISGIETASSFSGYTGTLRYVREGYRFFNNLSRFGLIVIIHTRPELPPSLTMVFPTLLWRPTDPQDGGV
jgi:hypothetical protein